MRNTTSVLLRPDTDPGRILETARQAEAAGFDTLWVVEDCFLGGGIAQAGVALSATSRIGVGIGVLPAAARNPAFAAMEIATLAGVFPGRLVVGIGHGMPGWMRQAGAWPGTRLQRSHEAPLDTGSEPARLGETRFSPLTLLRETLQATRALLAGESVSMDGRYVKLADVRLAHPPAVVPTVLAGVRGPKSLELAGRWADGVILAEPVTPEYLAVVQHHMGTGAAAKIVAYNVAAIDDNASTAYDLTRTALQWIGEPDWAAHLAPLPFADEFAALRRRSATREAFADSLPDSWVEQLAIAGTPASARRRIEQLHAAGAGDVVLIPAGPDPVSALASLAPLANRAGTGG